MNNDPVDCGTSTGVSGSDSAIIEPKLGKIYVIELCSGELRRWRYLGSGEQSHVWWHDVETGLEFSETSVMYAWRIVGIEDKSFQPELESSGS